MTEDQFNLLSKEEQRVAIVREVLERIEAKILNPRRSTFFCAVNAQGDIIKLFGRDAKTYINNIPQTKVTCYVCLLGSLFCGAAIIKNNIVFDVANIGEYLSTWFSTKELALLELFFEGFISESWQDDGYNLPSDLLTNEEYLLVEGCFNRDQSAEYRVKLALNHIIAINGAEITAEALCKL